MSRPEKHKGEVVGGGKVRARLKWIDGPATFISYIYIYIIYIESSQSTCVEKSGLKT